MLNQSYSLYTPHHRQNKTFSFDLATLKGHLKPIIPKLRWRESDRGL